MEKMTISPIQALEALDRKEAKEAALFGSTLPIDSSLKERSSPKAAIPKQTKGLLMGQEVVQVVLLASQH